MLQSYDRLQQVVTTCLQIALADYSCRTYKVKMDPDSKAIYEEIRGRICLLEYKPGEMISENALASEFDVSRSRMRRVMWQLESDGLVNISKGSGAVITAVDIKSLKEIYIVRQKLIELIGEMRPARITPDIISNLETLIQQVRQMEDTYDPVELAKLYYRFHSEMLRTIRNTFLKEITDKLYHRTARVWLQLLPDLNWAEEVSVMCDEIRSVTEALRREDMAAVARVRREHMAMLLQRINNYLGDVHSVERR